MINSNPNNKDNIHDLKKYLNKKMSQMEISLMANYCNNHECIPGPRGPRGLTGPIGPIGPPGSNGTSTTQIINFGATISVLGNLDNPVTANSSYLRPFDKGNIATTSIPIGIANIMNINSAAFVGFNMSFPLPSAKTVINPTAQIVIDALDTYPSVTITLTLGTVNLTTFRFTPSTVSVTFSSISIPFGFNVFNASSNTTETFPTGSLLAVQVTGSGYATNLPLFATQLTFELI